MGVVYRARETSLDRPVAIKVLRRDFLSGLTPDQAQDISQRFLQEARAAAALSHPGITTIYRVGVEEGVAFIAMEWLEGTTLEEKISASAPLPVELVARMGVSLLETLHAAHEKGIVHRDIKPANLIVLEDGRVKITDFGIAHVRGSQLVKTQAGAMMGTPIYAPPEQLSGQEIDGRADIYSTGVVLFESLSRDVPFFADNLLKLVSLILNHPPQSLREINPLVPSALEAIIMRALAKAPADRWGSALEMANALRDYASASPAASGEFVVSSTLAGQGGPLVTPQPIPTPIANRPSTHTAVVEGRNAIELVANLVRNWPNPRAMGEQETQPLLARLLERPLHAPAFSGAAQLGSAIFLLHEGLIYGIIDPSTLQVGDRVFENLPSRVTATLYPRPPGYDERTVPALASSIHPPQVRHENLDSSFVNVPQLAQKLSQEEFDGVLRLSHARDRAMLYYSKGRNILNVFTPAWPGRPAQREWQSWIAEVQVMADVDEQRIVLPAFSYRQELRNFAFDITPVELPPGAERQQRGTLLGSSTLSGRDSESPQSIQIRPSTGSDRSGARGHTTMQGIYTSDPVVHFLHWMLNDLPDYFAERERLKRWRYLAEWVGLIQNAVIHHDLPRPASSDADFFDMVTFDEAGKALHTVHRVAHGSQRAVADFIERVMAAKTARIKTGDIGGALLVAPSFDKEALVYYDKTVNQEESSNWFHKAQDALFTGYEGFVRIGSRRGFHLLLVTETAQGYQPLLP